MTNPLKNCLRSWCFVLASTLPACAADTGLETSSPSTAEPAQLETAMADPSDTFPEFEPEKFETTDSGLKYRIIKEGNETKPGPRDRVEVHYAGTFPDGREFDSSYKRGETITFGLNQVIKGWTEGMQLIGEEGAIQLIIPGDLAYGASPPPGIPPNATLHFNVELFDVK